MVKINKKRNYENLVILGNGFDLDCGLNSGYDDFIEFMGNQYPDDKKHIDEFWQDYGDYDYSPNSENYLWEDFENNLSKFDYREFIKEYTDDYECLKGLFCCLTNLYKNLNAYFIEWIKSLKCDKILHDRIIKSSYFLTFNYTDTLEKFFHLSEECIYHIHGSVKGNRIIYGHQKEKGIITLLDDIHEGYENFSKLDTEAFGLIHQYFEKTEKPVDQIIEESCFLKKIIQNVKHIYIYGFSYGKVDFPYFQFIRDCTNAKWHLGCYNQEDRNRANVYIKELDLDNYEILPDGEIKKIIFDEV